MPKNLPPSFYAVRAGRQTGVFMTWAECEEQVRGFTGAKYRKFTNAAEAEAFVTGELVAGASPVKSPAETSNNKSKKRALPAEPEDESGWDVVYSDGACKGNGQAGSVAGVGVWWGINDPRNIAERCPGDQTNNRAELIAILRILETTPRSKKPLLIKTDSRYSIDCFQKWLPNWRKNGFKAATGAPVKNAGLIQYLSAHLDARALYGQQIRLKHVKGHSGEEGNEGADAQANKGAMFPAIPERDWEQLEVELREQMKTEQATRSADQQTVPMEVEADNLPTGNAMKVRKVSGEGSPSAPAGHLALPTEQFESSIPKLSAPPPAAEDKFVEAPKTKALSNEPFDSQSTPKLNVPPLTVESKAIEAPLPPKRANATASSFPQQSVESETRRQVIMAAMRSPSPVVETKPVDAPSLPKPTSTEPSTSSSPRKIAGSASRARTIMAAMRSPSPAVESKPVDAPTLPKPTSTEPSTSSSPRKVTGPASRAQAIAEAMRSPTPAVASTLREASSLLKPTSTELATPSSPTKSVPYASKTHAIIASLRSPSKTKPSQAQPSSPSRSPRRVPVSKVSSVMQALFPSKSTSTEQQTSSSPSKGAPSPTKIWSRIPLARSPSKTVYSKDPPVSSSSLKVQPTETEESQPSQTTTESFVTALTTIIPTPVDSPSIEPAPAAQYIYPSLPEQSTKEDPPKSPARIVVNKEDIDFSMYVDGVVSDEDLWMDLYP